MWVLLTLAAGARLVWADFTMTQGYPASDFAVSYYDTTAPTWTTFTGSGDPQVAWSFPDGCVCMVTGNFVVPADVIGTNGTFRAF